MAGQSYRFLVCGPDGAPVGEALNARVRQHTQLLNGVHSASVALPLTDSAALGLTPGTGRLKVYRSPSQAQLAANPGAVPSLLFYGQLPATNVMLDTGSSPDTDGVVTAVFQDPRWRFAFMDTLGTENYTGVDQGDILWNLVLAQHGRPPTPTIASPIQPTNPTFAVDTSSWAASPGTISRDAVVFDTSPGSLKLNFTVEGQTSTAAWTSGSFVPGRTYVLTGSIRVDNAAILPRISVQDANGATMATSTLILAANTWTPFSLQFAPQTSGSPRITLTCTPEFAGNAWIDSLLLSQSAAGGFDTYLLQGSTVTGTLRTRDYTLAAGSGPATLQQRFDEMVALDGGCDYDVTPVDGQALATPTMQMGALNVYAKQGSNRPNAVFALGADLKSNVQQITLSYAPLVTYSTHTSTDTNGQPIMASAGTPSSAAGQYGGIEALQSDSSVIDSTTLSAKAIADIALMGQLRPIVTITNPLIDAPAAFEDYFIGDTIYVSCRKGSLVLSATPMRVHGIDLVIDENGYENVTITATNL